MIYKIKEQKNKLIEKAYKEGMRELKEFFGINWTYNIPNVCILDSRKEMEGFFGKKSESWQIGSARNGTIYVLAKEKIRKESSHKNYNDEKYFLLIKHELCHLFFEILSKTPGRRKPVWLSEGVSIFLSGQLEHYKPILEFKNFLSSYETHSDGVYKESGFAIKLLVKNFGKEKLLKMISGLRETNSEIEFNRLFKKIYGFTLNYKNLNILLSRK